MTTPESLALLLSYTDASRLFAGLRCIIVDESHALFGGKRGDLLAVARLSRLARGGLTRDGLTRDGLTRGGLRRVHLIGRDRLFRFDRSALGARGR